MIGANAGNQTAFRLRTEIPHCRSLWIGVLQGTWQEMGVQYGRRCGKDIARTFDLYWEKEVLRARATLWQTGRTEHEKVRYATNYLQRSYAELSHLRPELIEMLEGMAKGAADELDQCVHAGACTHFLKIALINYSSTSHFHPDWDFSKDCPAPAGSPGSPGHPSSPPEDDADCNGFWVKGEATRTGHSYATRTAQSRHIEPGGSARERQVSYVAIPDDPAARVFWGNSRAGNLVLLC